MFMCINVLLALLGIKKKVRHVSENVPVNICTDRLLFWRNSIKISTTIPKKALTKHYLQLEQDGHTWYSHTWQ